MHGQKPADEQVAALFEKKRKPTKAERKAALLQRKHHATSHAAHAAPTSACDAPAADVGDDGGARAVADVGAFELQRTTPRSRREEAAILRHVLELSHVERDSPAVSAALLESEADAAIDEAERDAERERLPPDARAEWDAATRTHAADAAEVERAVALLAHGGGAAGATPDGGNGWADELADDGELEREVAAVSTPSSANAREVDDGA